MQLYFVDACRNLPAQIAAFETLQTTSVFDSALAGRDDRRAPIFYASVPDAKAGAIPLPENAAADAILSAQTLFSRALLQCLQGGGAQPPDDDAPGRAAMDWHVTYQSLHEALVDAMADQNAAFKFQQELIADGFGRDEVISYLTAPPNVALNIQLEPDEAVAVTTLQLDSANSPAFSLGVPEGQITPHPYPCQLPAGFYILQANAKPPFASRQKVFQALPPRAACRMRL